MNKRIGVLGLAVGLAVGALAGWVMCGPTRSAAAGDDRYEDYVMSTGPVNAGQVGPDLDGVWLLDYRAGKLLGTVINRLTGKVAGWAEVDLVTEFGIPPRQNVHFLMTTGLVTTGQAALYIAETSTGKFGVYTMLVTPEGPQAGIIIRRHDLVPFRAPKPAPANP